MAELWLSVRLGDLLPVGALVPRPIPTPLTPRHPAGRPNRLCSRAPWQLDADHPDKDGLQLKRLAAVLKVYAEQAAEKPGGKCGVFWDYCA